jgi:hypothetical protein
VVHQVQPAAVADDPVLLVQARRGADRAADGDAHPVRLVDGEIDPAVHDRAPRGHHRELGRPVHPADLLRGEAVLLGVEVHLGGDLRAEGARVEEGDPARGGAPLAQHVPEPVLADAAGRQHLDPGDDDSTAAHRDASQE